ncbi:diguanylate cyclase [Crocosphaera sp. Alani8]|uniref:diguanylate cyclase n=1 Tax=Crocosphaera sp. Alani8 TaxID=3038952 RepID=UPI00313C901E
MLLLITWKRSQRQNSPMSLLLCDLDFFKSYNDYYGHRQGDLCLRKVALILENILQRPGDMVFRYGGEEFALILPNTPSQGAEFMAQQITQRVQLEKITHSSSPISSYLSVSLGIAVTVDSKIPSNQTLFEMADMALYRANLHYS